MPDNLHNMSRREFLRWAAVGGLALVAWRLLRRPGGVRTDCAQGCAACHQFSSCGLPAAEQRKKELLQSKCD